MSKTLRGMVVGVALIGSIMLYSTARAQEAIGKVPLQIVVTIDPGRVFFGEGMISVDGGMTWFLQRQQDPALWSILPCAVSHGGSVTYEPGLSPILVEVYRSPSFDSLSGGDPYLDDTSCFGTFDVIMSSK